MISFLKSCWRRRWLRGVVYTLVSLLLVAVLLYQWINWKGARAWQAAQDRYSADGETLDIAKLLPQPIPEAQNYGAIPLLRYIALESGSDARRRLGELELGSSSERPALADGVTRGQAIDLKAWEKWLRAEERWALPEAERNPAATIMQMLKSKDEVVEPLVAALDRRGCRWIPEWEDAALPGNFFAIPMPHYQPVQRMARYLCLRSVVAAQLGDARQAHDLVRVQLRLAQASLEDPFLIGELVGAAVLKMAMSSIWEICRLHVGTVDDFRVLSEELAEFDLHAAVLRACRTELAGAVGTLQWLKSANQNGALLMAADPKEPSHLDRLGRLIPSGWVDLNMATLVDLEHRWLIKPLREGGLRAMIHSTELRDELVRRGGWWHVDSVFAKLVIPSVQLISARLAQTQAEVDQAIIACGLEQARLATQGYPETLPVELQRTDVMSGQPMHYQRQTDGAYRLWSVGPDGVDGGGVRPSDEAMAKKMSSADYKGDWVWAF